MIGTCAVFALRAAQTAQRALGRDFAHLLGRFEFAESPCDGEPVVALHCAVFGLRDWYGGHGAIRSAVFADEAMRVG